MSSSSSSIFSLKSLSLFLLVFQNSSIALLTRYSRLVSSQSDADGEDDYLPSTAVFVTEVLKGLISFGVYVGLRWWFGGDEDGENGTDDEKATRSATTTSHRHNGFGVSRFWNEFKFTLWKLLGRKGSWKEMGNMAIPAGLYCLQNNLLYLSLSHLPPPIYQVIYQLKILTTAFFSYLLLSRPLSKRQIFALGLLILGVIAVEWDGRINNAATNNAVSFTTTPATGVRGKGDEKDIKDKALSMARPSDSPTTGLALFQTDEDPTFQYPWSIIVPSMKRVGYRLSGTDEPTPQPPSPPPSPKNWWNVFSKESAANIVGKRQSKSGGSKTGGRRRINDESRSEQNPTLGVISILLACLSSGLAGCWFEGVLKGVVGFATAANGNGKKKGKKNERLLVERTERDGSGVKDLEKEMGTDSSDEDLKVTEKTVGDKITHPPTQSSSPPSSPSLLSRLLSLYFLNLQLSLPSLLFSLWTIFVISPSSDREIILERFEERKAKRVLQEARRLADLRRKEKGSWWEKGLEGVGGMGNWDSWKKWNSQSMDVKSLFTSPASSQIILPSSNSFQSRISSLWTSVPTVTPSPPSKFESTLLNIVQKSPESIKPHLSNGVNWLIEVGKNMNGKWIWDFKEFRIGFPSISLTSFSFSSLFSSSLAKYIIFHLSPIFSPIFRPIQSSFHTLVDFLSAFLAGFEHPLVWTVVLNMALGGLLVAMVVREADGVKKGFATSLSIVVSAVLSMCFWSFSPGPLFFAGATTVIVATVLFARG